MAANGERVLEVQSQTLAAGHRLLDTWAELEPIVKALIALVRSEVEAGEIEKPASLLSQCAVVVQKVGAAASGVLKPSEGLAKLSLILDASRPMRRAPGDQSQRDNLQVVLACTKAIWESGQPCPTCERPHAVEVG